MNIVWCRHHLGVSHTGSVAAIATTMRASWLHPSSAPANRTLPIQGSTGNPARALPTGSVKFPACTRSVIHICPGPHIHKTQPSVQSLLLHLTVDNEPLCVEPHLTAGQYMHLSSGTSKAKQTEATQSRHTCQSSKANADSTGSACSHMLEAYPSYFASTPHCSNTLMVFVH